MKMSPDGKREVIEMLVPVTGSKSRTVRITGLGLPPKIGVGAVDLPDSSWTEILNRDVKGHLAYDTVETVRGGMMLLDDRHLQGRDQMYAARSGATFGMGTLEAPVAKAGEAVTVEEGSAPGGTMAWIVTDSRKKGLLVVPDRFDSFEVAERIARTIHGEFTVEMVSSAMLSASEEIAAPGWRVLLYPAVQPDARNVLRN